MEFVDLVCEGISCNILLKSQLKLGYDALMKDDFESDIRDGYGFSKPALDLEDPEFLLIFCLE